MSYLEVIILAFIQGFTEFLPISSSGHLVLAEHFLSTSNDQALTFTIIIHLGTLLAVLLYFRQTILNLLKGLLSREKESIKLTSFIVIGTVPLVFIGLFFGDILENAFNSVQFVLISMFLTGIFFLLAEYINKKNLLSTKNTFLKSLLIGLSQAIAVLPGVSRSGTTLATGVMLGLDRVKAAEYSFLLAMPAIAGAGILGLKDILSQPEAFDFAQLSVGFLISFIAGYISIFFLMKLYKTKSLNIFAYYLIIVSLILGFFLIK
jgi:undecaprenyl-diphosphatase